ncbi:MAG: SDR family NAD(P)-dependent oxidoreductase [Verrucomicrobia bacterium]|nr:MAG: SDR family NAD(P)-dependent oxidoreductase [Verrucomicrobiota bacterium]
MIQGLSRKFSTMGCTALITGATAGLGSEFAKQLAPVAARLILVGRREERLGELSASLKKSFPSLRLDTLKADLSLSSERLNLSSRIIREQIPVNLLINNAGLGDLGTFDTAEWERIAPMLEVNVTALTHLTHLLLPMLRAQSPSGILNVSSVAGFYPLPEMAVYAATKAYVTSFSEALRMELAPEGINVTALCPGPVPTEFFDVAGRNGETIRAMERTHPSLASTPELVVRQALIGLERDKPGVIPNPLLALLVRGSRLLPFPVIREAIRLGVGPKRPQKV